MNECIFCKIVNKEIPATIIYEDEEIISFMDIKPISEGHLLIIPKKHYEDFMNVDPELMTKLTKIAQNIGRKVLTIADGFNFSTNQGKAAGQEIFHLHFHLIPRKNNDGLISWPNNKTTQEEIKKIAEKLKQ